MQLLVIVSFLWLPEVIVCPHVSYEKHQRHADTDGGGKNSYDGGDYGGYESWEYGTSYYWEYELEKIEPEPVVLECYTCHFTKMEHHEHGMPNCDDPFQRHNVPVVTCEGLCAKTKSVIGKGEYMVTRSCLPHCKTIYDDLSTTQCCYGNLCNGAHKNAAPIVSPSKMVYFSMVKIYIFLLKYYL